MMDRNEVVIKNPLPVSKKRAVDETWVSKMYWYYDLHICPNFRQGQPFLQEDPVQFCKEATHVSLKKF